MVRGVCGHSRGSCVRGGERQPHHHAVTGREVGPQRGRVGGLLVGRGGMSVLCEYQSVKQSVKSSSESITQSASQSVSQSLFSINTDFMSPSVSKISPLHGYICCTFIYAVWSWKYLGIGPSAYCTIPPESSCCLWRQGERRGSHSHADTTTTTTTTTQVNKQVNKPKKQQTKKQENEHIQNTQMNTLTYHEYRGKCLPLPRVCRAYCCPAAVAAVCRLHWSPDSS